jgi:PAS domain-containing protein
MAPIQRDIELILLRQWASYLTMPIWVMDQDGNLLFYNEPAEPLLGRRYDEAGEMPLQELATLFDATDEEGIAIPTEGLPIGVALMKGRPSHRRVRIRGLDGHQRNLDITAFPIIGQGGRKLGAVAMFWEFEEGGA